MLLNLEYFVLPARTTKSLFDLDKVRVCAIIPTYKPGALTANLVRDLVKWNPHITVYVVDDCTPQGYGESLQIFEQIALLSRNVVLLRTPVNTLKAGALNYALKHIFERKEDTAPDVILTLDDDVVIDSTTVKNLIFELMSGENLGAVCSQCTVLNKNKNILTRLQGLEYLGFNATRLADEGFYGGPLVMHGMLTAFRGRALAEVGGFVERHLIEDYDITMRLKALGWKVKVAINAPAWTIVPERFSTLWRQRTRWSYGGITVVTGAKRFSAVIQDLLGHGLFFLTVVMIDVLILFSLFSKGGSSYPQIAKWIIFLSFFQLAVWYTFQLWLMRQYKERDLYDWLLRIALIPEFIYSNVMTVVVLGSYSFFIFNILTKTVTQKSWTVVQKLVTYCRTLFYAAGYSDGWGTRTS